jgi:hypothetical protein
MSSLRDRMQEAARTTHENETAVANELARTRPSLTAEGVVDYLDWIGKNLKRLGPDAAHHMTLAELTIRTRATDAQGKATAHTDQV